MSAVPDDLAFLQWLIDECGCRSPKPIPGRQWAAIMPKLFTTAIAIGPMFDERSVTTHWCYETAEQAKAALDAWDGTGEPEGWLRHPESGRRRSRTGEEIGDDGKKVGAIGVIYELG